MQVFLFYLIVCFIGGSVLWKRKPAWRIYLLLAMVAFLCIAYRYLDQL